MVSVFDRVLLRRTGLTCVNGALDTTNIAVGAADDAAASSDAGTFSLIALIKRLLQKFPNLGRTTMAGSVSVAIASDQASVPVTPAALVAGTAAIGDVGMQYRANATGAATIHPVVAAAGTNAANVKDTAGRLVGWSLANPTAAWVYVKLHNTPGVPTAGVGVVMTIGIPPGGMSELSLAGGIAFSAGIGISIVTGAAATDATAVAANAVVGTLLFA